MIITRYHNTTEEKLTIEFLSPTFLGGADQHAELRSAPLKNLLRQWWRVAVGNQYTNSEDFLEAENELFGTSLSGKDAQASLIRLALFANAHEFEISSQPFDFGTTYHPEVAQKGKGNISNALYLGFGPIVNAPGGTKPKSYIMPGSRATIILTFPYDKQELFHLILQLIDAFGTVGSRGRNGYGSFALSGKTFSRANLGTLPSQPLSELINREQQYPSSLGSATGRLLCWETSPQKDWKGIMETLAGAYLKTRTSVNIAQQGLQQRHIIGYPVTNHPVTDWGGSNGRMPSQLRLMVKRNHEDKLVGRILHLPHKLPKRWDSAKLGSELAVWQKIHGLLDAHKGLYRHEGKQ
ncbi:MAG: hypothetical protein P4L42_13890 [Desulfocapsaceae bacterium]|nr:hypothetical protein [Desulfocapsaceae bacterium]